MNDERPKRERPTLTELNLLVEEHEKESDPERKEELRQQLEKMEKEVAEANQS